MRKNSILVSLVLFLLCICGTVSAQKFTGTITGVITDSQGAVVGAANVTVTNQATGAARTATTDPSGVYTVPELEVGTYNVSIKAPNFKEFVAKDVELNTSSTATVNATL